MRPILLSRHTMFPHNTFQSTKVWSEWRTGWHIFNICQTSVTVGLESRSLRGVTRSAATSCTSNCMRGKISQFEVTTDKRTASLWILCRNRTLFTRDTTCSLTISIRSMRLVTLAPCWLGSYISTLADYRRCQPSSSLVTSSTSDRTNCSACRFVRRNHRESELSTSEAAVIVNMRTAAGIVKPKPLCIAAYNRKEHIDQDQVCPTAASCAHQTDRAKCKEPARMLIKDFEERHSCIDTP